MTTKPMFTALLVAALALSTGCVFSKKNSRPKESSAISSEVEATFRQRWLEKRVTELTAQGVAADQARPQAEQEFRDRFGFDQKLKK
jgi:hypothetical protein